MSQRGLSRLLAIAFQGSGPAQGRAPAAAAAQFVSLRGFRCTSRSQPSVLQALQAAWQSAAARGVCNSPGAAQKRCEQVCQRGPLLPLRGGGGARRFSNKATSGATNSDAAGSAAASSQQPSVLQRARQASQASSGAFKALTQTAGSTSQAAYKQLPEQVKRWAGGLQQGRLQKALGLQAEAFWQHHRSKVFAAGGLTLVYILWKTLFSVTSIFVNLSETMAELGFLSLSAAIVAFAGLYLRHRFTINPRAVYRQAMIRLNTHPSVLEVMGAPLAGSDVRAQVLTGGGFRLKGLVPKYRSRRLQMIFPLRGAEHRGLVSLEAKRRRGKYDFKLLAVDVPTAAGPDQRLFLAGDDHTYQRGSIIAELRDPFLQALTMAKVYEEEDEADDALDEAEEERQRAEKEAARAAGRPKPLDQGGGLYFYERVWLGIRGLVSRQREAAADEAPAPAASETAPAKRAPSAAAPAKATEVAAESVVAADAAKPVAKAA